MQIIDGKKIANDILAELKKEIELKRIKPCLAIVLVGDNPSSVLYIKAKERAAERIGVKVEKNLLPKESSESQILKVIKELNKNSDINGILIQLPLPKGISPDRIIKEIKPKKDVDGLLPNSNFDSPFILSIWEALKATKEDLKNKKIFALVNSEVFGRRLSLFFKRKGLKVEYAVFERKEKEIKGQTFQNDIIRNAYFLITKRWKGLTLNFFPRITTERAALEVSKADILITALGKPEVIKGDMLKQGVILIDGGISRVDSGTAGDIDAGSVRQKAKWLSPVPGGLGPLTVAFLLKNLIRDFT